MDINLLEEIIDKIKNNGKQESAVKWVGVHGKSFSWEEFKKIADFEYDNSFGVENIDSSLIIVGIDWWIERHEYDGSEWWEFKILPDKPPLGTPVPEDIKTRSQIEDEKNEFLQNLKAQRRKQEERP